jgi:GH25 family lysozyme M1 (1,4-beta-N-acetylmuramidase)
MELKGIDVSQHNGIIDWSKVKSQIGFTVLRLGWIGNKNNHTLDTQFENYYNECKRLAIPVGVYVYNYCNSEDTVKSGADWVIQKLQGKSLELPVYIDMEDSSLENLGKEKLTNICIAFGDKIENAGFWHGVYANKNWFTNYLNKDILGTKYTCWIAQYNSECNLAIQNKDMWQYSESGKVDGISGNVDMDILYRDIFSEMKGSNTVIEKEEDFEMAKTYRNGSTPETVYSDSNCTNKIGSLNAYETCECLGIVNGVYIVKYQVNNTNNYKVGFVKYSGGVK